jgi:hypothetical protein
LPNSDNLAAELLNAINKNSFLESDSVYQKHKHNIGKYFKMWDGRFTDSDNNLLHPIILEKLSKLRYLKIIEYTNEGIISPNFICKTPKGTTELISINHFEQLEKLEMNKHEWLSEGFIYELE